MSRLWRTRSGVIVEEHQRAWVLDRRRGRVLKIEAYRVETGGFHGWLTLDHLTPFAAARGTGERA